MRLGPVKSVTVHDSGPLPQLSPAAQQQVMLALSVLKDITSIYMYDNLQMQVIYDAGTLPALHFILKRQDDIKNPEIITLGCQIIANVMRSPDNATKTSLTQGDFVDVLVELIEYVSLSISMPNQ